MKKNLLAFFILLSTFSFGQVAHVFSIDSDIYTITFSKNDNNYDFNLSKIGKDDIKNFTLPKLDIGTFRTVIYQKINELDGIILTNYKKNNEKIDEIFYTSGC